jgi:hypothetical protein
MLGVDCAVGDEKRGEENDLFARASIDAGRGSRWKSDVVWCDVVWSAPEIALRCRGCPCSCGACRSEETVQ